MPVGGGPAGQKDPAHSGAIRPIASTANRRTVIAGLTGLGVCGGLVTLAHSYDERPRLDDLILFFDYLALLRRAKDGGLKPGWIRKWQRSVAVRTSGMAAVSHREHLREILATLSEWTGISFRLDASPNARRVISVYFLSDREMKRHTGPKSTVCLASTEGNNGRIRTGKLRIAEGYADCLAHEFMHVIGFDNHWPGLRIGVGAPSVLADRYAPERRNWFTPWDEIAIRTLYHPDLVPGTNRERALPIARTLLKRLVSG